MWLTLLAVAVGLVAGLVAGGQLRAIAAVRPRGVVFAMLWLGLTSLTRWNSIPMGRELFWAANLCAIIFCAKNVTGMRTGIMLAGVGLNAFMIGVHGAMPYRISAVIAADLARIESDFPTTVQTRPEAPGDRFFMLADVIPINAGPLKDVLSIGDLLLAIGIGYVVYRTTLQLDRKPRRTQEAAAVFAPPTTPMKDAQPLASVRSGTTRLIDLAEPQPSRLTIELTADRAMNADRWHGGRDLGNIEELDDLSDEDLIDLTDDESGDEFWAARTAQRRKRFVR
jgi:hypothetical protein